MKRAKHLAEEYGERAVNKVKSVRDEVFHSEQDEPSSSDDEGMPYTRPVKFKAAHGFKGPFDFDHVRVVQDLSGEHMVRRRRRGRGREPRNTEQLNELCYCVWSGSGLDDEVLSLRPAPGYSRARQRGTHLGPKKRIRLL